MVRFSTSHGIQERNGLSIGHIQEEHLVARKHMREFLAICFSLQTLVLLSGLPLVTIVSSKVKIQEGGNLTFTCQVTGNPTPSVRWQTEELHSNVFTQVRLKIIYIFMHYLFFSAAYILFLPFFGTCWIRPFK